MPTAYFLSKCKYLIWSLLFSVICPLVQASPALDRSETKEVKQKNGAYLYSLKKSGQPLQGQIKVKRGSTIITCPYQSGFRNGSCQHHKKDGLLTRVEFFVNGLRKSDTRYHRDGKQIKEVTTYNPNTAKKHGAYARYNKAGVERVKGTYADGKRTGQWVLRSDENKLSQQVGFKDGKKHGADLKYNAKGQLQYKTHYANGKRHGAYAYYSGKGEGNTLRLSEQGSYQNDNKHQTWIRYRSNSNEVQTKNYYEAGVLLESYRYHDNGNLFEHQKKNKDGALLSIETYYPDGKREERRTFTYANGMRSEKRESWNKDGSKKQSN